MSSRRLRRELAVSVAAPLGLVLVVLVGWQIYVWLSDIRPQTLPGPIRIVRESVESAGSIWEHSLVTMSEVAAGFAISIVCAPDARAVARSLRAGSQSAVSDHRRLADDPDPGGRAADDRLVRFGVTPKIIVIGLFTFVPIVLGFAAGLAATERPTINLMRNFGASRWQMYRYVKIPAALPDLFTGLRIAAIYAVLGAIFGELAGATDGLGIFLEQSRLSFRTDLVFGAIFVVRC